MPRGGRRPGAGARKGNFNALKGGSQSSRLAIVYRKFMGYPDRQELALILDRAGFVTADRAFNGDTRGLARFLWQRWFERSGPDDRTPPVSIEDAPRPGAASDSKRASKRLAGAGKREKPNKR